MRVNVTVTVRGDVAEIVPAGSKPGQIAKVLLAAADDPAMVRTITTSGGMGWQVPVRVARSAGLINDPAPAKKAPARKRRKPVTPDA